MKSKLTDVFIRAVINKVEDCSNPMQLRGYLNKYKSYVFSPAIHQVFIDRIEVFREEFQCNSLYLNACDDLEDILEFEIEVSKIIQPIDIKNAHPKTVRSLVADPEIDVEEDYELSLNDLKFLIMEYQGNLTHISEIEDYPISFLNQQVKKYRLQGFLRTHKR